MQVLFCDLHSAVVLADNVWSSRQNYQPYVMVHRFRWPILSGNSTTPTKVGRLCRSSDIPLIINRLGKKEVVRGKGSDLTWYHRVAVRQSYFLVQSQLVEPASWCERAITVSDKLGIGLPEVVRASAGRWPCQQKYASVEIIVARVMLADLQCCALQPATLCSTATCKYRVGHKKRGTLLLSISLPIIDWFSQFFYGHTLQTVCYNVIITYPTTP